MGFNLIIPAPKAKPGVIRIATIKIRNGPWRLQLSFPAAQFDLLFKQAEKFDLLLGDGADAGKMLIRPNAAGHFKPTFMKHTRIFRLPEMDKTPQLQLSHEEPERREMQGGGIVLTLPNWMEEERWKAILKAREQVSRERAADKQRGGR